MKLKLLLLFFFCLPVVFGLDKIVGVEVQVNTTGTGATAISVEGGNTWSFNCLTNFSTSQNITKIISIDDNSSNICNEKIGEVNAYCKDFLFAFNRSYDTAINTSYYFAQYEANNTYLQQKFDELKNMTTCGSNVTCDANLQTKIISLSECNSMKKTLEDKASDHNVQLLIAAVVGVVACYFFMRKKTPKSEADDINQYG